MLELQVTLVLPEYYVCMEKTLYAGSLIKKYEATTMNGILGVFQKLIASKSNDHEGFYLVQCLLHRLPSDVTQPFLKQIVTLLFQRLSSSRTTKYVKGLIAFFGFYACHFSADALVQVVDSVQENMFGLYVERVLVPDLQKVSGVLESKMAAVGCIRLLCDSRALLADKYAHLWRHILEVLISMFELPQDTTSLPDDHFVEVDDLPGYQAAYSQLSFAQSRQPDPLQDITDTRQHLAQSLGKLSQSAPGTLRGKLQELPDTHRQALQAYLTKYGVQIC